MRRAITICAVVGAAMAHMGCVHRQKSEAGIIAEKFVRGTTWLEGTFSSAEQAQQDERYYEVVLRHSRIWLNRGDGAWFYVEQALAASPESPYRQRVYRVWIRGDRTIESAVYELPNPEEFVGAEPARFEGLTPDELTLREGCEVVFTEITDEYMVGETADGSCVSTLRGAAYATSRVRLSKDEIRSWDQGWDADGAQVWGAEAGPYVFKRIH